MSSGVCNLFLLPGGMVLQFTFIKFGWIFAAYLGLLGDVLMLADCGVLTWFGGGESFMGPLLQGCTYFVVISKSSR